MYHPWWGCEHILGFTDSLEPVLYTVLRSESADRILLQDSSPHFLEGQLPYPLRALCAFSLFVASCWSPKGHTHPFSWQRLKQGTGDSGAWFPHPHQGFVLVLASSGFCKNYLKETCEELGRYVWNCYKRITGAWRKVLSQHSQDMTRAEGGFLCQAGVTWWVSPGWTCLSGRWECDQRLFYTLVTYLSFCPEYHMHQLLVSAEPWCSNDMISDQEQQMQLCGRGIY